MFEKRIKKQPKEHFRGKHKDEFIIGEDVDIFAGEFFEYGPAYGDVSLVLLLSDLIDEYAGEYV